MRGNRNNSGKETVCVCVSGVCVLGKGSHFLQHSEIDQENVREWASPWNCSRVCECEVCVQSKTHKEVRGSSTKIPSFVHISAQLF